MPSTVAEGLTEAPHLAAYVRDLYVWIGDSKRCGYNQLAAAFAVLTNVQRLIISAIHSWYSDSSCGFRISLHSLLCLPQLHSLALNCTEVPQPLLTYAFSKFRSVAFTLGLNAATPVIDEPVLDWHSNEAATGSLDHLFLKYLPYESPAQALHSTLLLADARHALTHLRSLTLEATDLQGLSAEIVIQCTSLEHLTIDLMMHMHREPSPYRLPRIPTLRFLTFKGIMTEVSMPSSWLAALASLPAQTQNLEVVTFRLSGRSELRTEQSPWPASVETAADEALISHPTLSSAHFIVCTDRVTGGSMQLPRCYAAGLLVFSSTSDEAWGWRSKSFAKYFGDPVLDAMGSLSEVTVGEA
ncbi:hypothetical protein C8R46DRAFT_1229580 [Mycena filopes]|nr:hypothetical protein C8R46DRAFT_1229580 [Mycena filopes]